MKDGRSENKQMKQTDTKEILEMSQVSFFFFQIRNEFNGEKLM